MFSIGTNYERWRINAIKLRFISQTASTTPGLYSIGFADDVVSGTSGGSSNYDDIANLRVSSVQSSWKDTTLIWTPTDKSKWYYTHATQVGVTVDDPRFVIPCSLLADTANITSATTVGTPYIEYEIVFKGATYFVT